MINLTGPGTESRTARADSDVFNHYATRWFEKTLSKQFTGISLSTFSPRFRASFDYICIFLIAIFSPFHQLGSLRLYFFASSS